MTKEEKDLQAQLLREMAFGDEEYGEKLKELLDTHEGEEGIREVFEIYLEAMKGIAWYGLDKASISSYLLEENWREQYEALYVKGYAHALVRVMSGAVILYRLLYESSEALPRGHSDRDRLMTYWKNRVEIAEVCVFRFEEVVHDPERMSKDGCMVNCFALEYIDEWFAKLYDSVSEDSRAFFSESSYEERRRLAEERRAEEEAFRQYVESIFHLKKETPWYRRFFKWLRGKK